MKKTVHDLRCFCRYTPLLAVYGLDENGDLYIELKVYKQKMVYGHMVAILKVGKILLECRECKRWQGVVVKTDANQVMSAALEVADSPIPVEENPQCLHADHTTE